MPLIDTHAHLDHLENLDQALARAADAGVEHIVAVSMDLASCKKNLEIKKRFDRPRIHLAMGIHPSEADANELDECVELIRKSRAELVAIGEIGLDFWYKDVRKDDAKKNEQRMVYQKLLATAKELDLPAIIHARGTWKECLQSVKEIGLRKVVFHWYSGPIDILDQILASGHYISASPALAHSPEPRVAISHAPMDRTLIETDCPVTFRNPDTQESFLSEPKDVAKTLEAYSALKNIARDEASAALNKNARDFFQLH